MGGFGCLRSAGWRCVGGLVLVCALVCAAFPASAAARVSPPVASGVLSGVDVAVGAAVSVDASVGFSGSVDAYAARSSDERVVAVAVSGSVLSLRGAAAGEAHVTVQATNPAGSAWQRFAVRVEAVPPPTLRDALGDLSLHVGAAEKVDLAPLFAGSVAAYSAASGDEGVASVAVSGSVMSVTGVGAGSAAVRYTATNAGGSAGSSLTVTVAADPPAAPTVAGALAPRTVAAGSAAAVDVAASFAGVVESYEATSSDESRLTVAVAGSVVSLTALSAGAVTVTVFAANSAGSASQTFDVAVVSGLEVAAAAPAYCLTGEGRPVVVSSSAAGSAAGAGASTLGREGVASVEVAYTVSGGRGPYTVVVGVAAAGARLSLPAEGVGAVEVSCARAGVNLNDVAARANAVEAGPKTVRLAVRDADGATAAAEVTFTVAEDVYTTAYNGGTMRAGRTYVIGDPDAWALITLPAGLDLRFEGVSEVDGEFEAGYFVDTASGSLVVLDWNTGAEVHRSISSAAPPRSAGDSAAATRNVDSLFDALGASTSIPAGVVYAGSAADFSGDDWRPYEGLPADTRVMMHESMLKGDPLTVCNAATVEDFYLEDFKLKSLDGTPEGDKKRRELLKDFNEAFAAAVKDWNEALYREKEKDGTPHRVFDIVSQTGNCDGEKETSLDNADVDIIVHKRTMGTENVCDGKIGNKATECFARHHLHGLTCKYSLGCARVVIEGFPLLMQANKTYHTIVTASDSSRFRSTIAHEIGHFLGPGDYKQSCPVDGDLSIKTLYTYTKLSGCLSPLDMPIAERDKIDVHAIYHPDKLVNVRVVDGDLVGRLPLDAENNLELNAHVIVAWSRPISGGDYSYVGSFVVHTTSGSGRMRTTTLNESVADGSFEIPLGGLDPAGREFLVAGVTRGDHYRLKDDPAPWTAHWEVPAEKLGPGSWVAGHAWTLGDPATLAVPGAAPGPQPPPQPPPPPPLVDPPVPGNLRVVGTSQNTVRLSWGAVSPVTSYDYHTTDPGSNTWWITRGIRGTSFTVPGLTASTQYRFKVRAVNGDRTSAWSPSVTASTDGVDPPPLTSPISVSGTVSVRRIPPRGAKGLTLEYSFTPTGGSRIVPTGRFVVYAELGTDWKQSSVVAGPTSQGTRDFGRILTRRESAGRGRIEVAFRPLAGNDVLPSPQRFIAYGAMTLNSWYTSSEITFTIPKQSSARAEGSASRSGDMLTGESVGCLECFEEDGEMEP